MGPTPARPDIMNSKFHYDCISLFITRSDCNAAKGFQFSRGRISTRQKIFNFARADFMAENTFPQSGQRVRARHLSLLYLSRETTLGSQPACTGAMNSKLQFELHHYPMTPTNRIGYRPKSFNIHTVFFEIPAQLFTEIRRRNQAPGPPKEDKKEVRDPTITRVRKGEMGLRSKDHSRKRGKKRIRKNLRCGPLYRVGEKTLHASRNLEMGLRGTNS